jgi:prolyl 4-hydroxylase
MGLEHLGGDWRSWVQHNISRGCDALELAAILGTHGFSSGTVKHLLGSAVAETILSTIDHQGLSNIKLTRFSDVIPSSGSPLIYRIPTDAFQIYTIAHFLSDEECDQLVKVVNTQLRPSTLTVQTADLSYRTSKTSDLCFINDPIVQWVDNKIANTLGIRLSYAEGTQAQRYDVGEQFKQHTDFFEPGTPEYQQFAATRGNRTWTFMIYLNTVKRGGGTTFFGIDQTFMPEKGLAIAWNNLYPDGRVNPNTLHAGLPVEEGEKIIVTKWFRERGDGPMFL